MPPPIELQHQAASIFKAAELLELLNERKYKVKWVDLPPHAVIAWEKEGLISFDKEGKDDWRQFSIMDYIWLHIISNFRSIGTPQALIKSLRDQVNEPISLEFIMDTLRLNPDLIDNIPLQEEREMIRNYVESEDVTLDNLYFSYLTLLVVESMAKRIPLTFILFDNGYFYPWFANTNVMDMELMKQMMYSNHVSVPLTPIFTKFLHKDDTGYYLETFGMLSPQEVELLNQVRSGEYLSVTVKFKNKEIKMLELVKEQNVTKRIVDILAESSYQEVQLKKHSGKITRIQNTHKIIF